MAKTIYCRHFFFSGKKGTVTPATVSLARHLSVSPPPPSTPPPDFNQCVMDSSHFLPLPFPNHRLANQQNSENMAAEKHKIACAEEATLLQMSCYSHGWQETSNNQIQDDRYLRTNTNRFSPGSRESSCPQIQNGGSDRPLLCPDGGLSQKEKRRFSKTSGTSNRMRSDDLSV